MAHPPVVVRLERLQVQGRQSLAREFAVGPRCALDCGKVRVGKEEARECRAFINSDSFSGALSADE